MMLTVKSLPRPKSLTTTTAYPHSQGTHTHPIEAQILTVFLQKMRPLWLMFGLGVHRQELVTEGLGPGSRWHALRKKPFRTRHNLPIITTLISKFQERLRVR